MTNPFLWIAVALALLLFRRGMASESGEYVSRDCASKLMDQWLDSEYEWRRIRGERTKPSKAWPMPPRTNRGPAS